jgi:hypothetical protein
MAAKVNKFFILQTKCCKNCYKCSILYVSTGGLLTANLTFSSFSFVCSSEIKSYNDDRTRLFETTPECVRLLTANS